MARRSSFSALIPLIFAVISTGGALTAQVEGEGWRFKPQIGIWFGPVTPMPTTRISEVITTSLGGGLFFRMNIPSNTWRIEVGTSYSYYTSRSVARLHSIPVYGAISYLIPINLPLAFQVKAGAGSNFLRSIPEGGYNWLPLGYLGFETSFPAGRLINIGVRADYFFVYERHLSPPSSAGSAYETYNAQFFNFGLMVNFNLAR